MKPRGKHKHKRRSVFCVNPKCGRYIPNNYRGRKYCSNACKQQDFVRKYKERTGLVYRTHRHLEKKDEEDKHQK